MIAAPRRRLSVEDRRNLRTALPFIAPWIVGFIAFTLYPIIYSLYLSFTHYSGFGDATPAGFENYAHMAADSLFWQSLTNTFAIWFLSSRFSLSQGAAIPPRARPIPRHK